jgi:hypothetical protein
MATDPISVRAVRAAFDQLYDAHTAGSRHGDVPVVHGGRYVAGEHPACPVGEILAALGVPAETLAGLGGHPVSELDLPSVIPMTPGALRALRSIQERGDREDHGHGTWRLLWHRVKDDMGDWAWGTDRAQAPGHR